MSSTLLVLCVLMVWGLILGATCAGVYGYCMGVKELVSGRLLSWRSYITLLGSEALIVVASISGAWIYRIAGGDSQLLRGTLLFLVIMFAFVPVLILRVTGRRLNRRFIESKLSTYTIWEAVRMASLPIIALGSFQALGYLMLTLSEGPMSVPTIWVEIFLIASYLMLGIVFLFI